MTQLDKAAGPPPVHPVKRGIVLGCGTLGFLFFWLFFALSWPVDKTPGSELLFRLRTIHQDIQQFVKTHERFPVSIEDLAERGNSIQKYQDPLRGYQEPWYSPSILFWITTLVLGVSTILLLRACRGSFIAMFFIVCGVGVVFTLMMALSVSLRPFKKTDRPGPEFLLYSPVGPLFPPWVLTIPGAHSPYGDYILLPDGTVMCTGQWAPRNKSKYN